MTAPAEHDPIAEALAPRLPLIAFSNNDRRITEWQRPTLNDDGSITVVPVGIHAGEVITAASITDVDGVTHWIRFDES